MSYYKPAKEKYPFVIPNMEDWPIVHLSNDRENFIKQLEVHTKDKVMEMNNVSDIIAKAIYLEKKRIKEEAWKVDRRDENKFWSTVRKKLVKDSLDKGEDGEVEATNEEILQRIINRYADEIVGNFKIRTYWFARRVLTVGFTRLLDSVSARNVFRGGMRYRLQERIQPVGELDIFRKLCAKGTVVVVPTHFSNLDSILIGLAMDFVGAPAFSYGAGLNLFNTGILAYFMNRLGAYRIDRRKKNEIYLETLKGFSQLTIERGTQSLFFPGGTRSRSGEIEKRLKMGLLSTVISAQRSNFESGNNEKIFVVPMVLSYHFVLEAKSLIEQHLRKTGKEHYITNDEFKSYFKILKFLWQFMKSSSELILHYGKPMDVMGNFVDEEGNSFDLHGNKIEVQDYFISEGEVKNDKQRDAVYTKMLADKIIERFHCENVVLTSHVVAFTAFNVLWAKHPHLDLYGIMRLAAKDLIFDKQEILDALGRIQKHLIALEEQERLQLSDAVRQAPAKILEEGLHHINVYHDLKPLTFDKSGKLVSQSVKLLYYYHNKLLGYQLEKDVQWIEEEDMETVA